MSEESKNLTLKKLLMSHPYFAADPELAGFVAEFVYQLDYRPKIDPSKLTLLDNEEPLCRDQLAHTKWEIEEMQK